ncbi:MAG: TROVE domain-containing protein [Armatimonadota bacterium]
MQKLSTWFNLRATKQSQAIPGSNQVANDAGGFAWALDSWQQLDRFLVLGTEGGTFYAEEKSLTVEAATNVVQLLHEDGVRVVTRVREISEAGRAYKNDPALFALALAFAVGDPATRLAAVNALPAIARTGTHLFTFLEYADSMRGWGRGLRRAVAGWYDKQSPEALAYQVTKYMQRNGWSHRDALRLAHPKATDAVRNALYAYVVGKGTLPDGALETPWGYLQAVARVADTNTPLDEVCRLITEYRLPREVLPTGLLNEYVIWEMLLEQMPMTAMIRNLATMTRVGALSPLGAGVKTVCARLGDRERLRKARIHPVQILAALKTYAQGQGVRGQHRWTPVQDVVDALDQAFYLTFDNVEPTGQRIMLAVDISGSMGFGTINGVPGLTPRDAAAALSLVTAATEPNRVIVGFTEGTRPSQWSQSHGLGSGISPLKISPRQRLDEVTRYMADLPMGGTDCALPMVWALEQKLPVDAFIVLTDSETWAGNIHPAQALQQYRQQMKIPAKFIVVGMTSNGFTIGDPRDAGTLNVVGFSPDVPGIISDFIRGTV